MARKSDSAARVLYSILEKTGYVKKKVDMARILRINDSNISSYLARHNTKGKRIHARLDTISQWCWVLNQTTGLKIKITIDPSAEVVFEIEGHDAQGLPLESWMETTSYREQDQIPSAQWEKEWIEFIKKYERFFVESKEGLDRS